MTSRISVRNGSLIAPEVHDAHLMGLLSRLSGECAVILQPLGGLPIELVFHDTRHLRGQNFREGNIVLGVSVLSGSEVDYKDIAALYDMDDSPTPSKPLEALLRKIHAEALVVVSISPSYGAQILCVCRGISTRPHVNTNA